MDKIKLDITELLDYLQEMVENSPRVPITGKAMVDIKDFEDVVQRIIEMLPDQFKKAQWVVSEKDRILENAQKEYQSVREETIELMKGRVEKHDIVKEAKLRANEIIASAQKDAKAIRIGSREYSTEILTQLDEEIEKKKLELIESMQKSFEKVAKEIDDNLSESIRVIRDNITELRDM